MQSKVIRVLNLWQRNAVFPPEVIQPLFDMADSAHPKYKEVAAAVGSKGGAGHAGPTPSKSMSSSNAANPVGAVRYSFQTVPEMVPFDCHGVTT